MASAASSASVSITDDGGELRRPASAMEAVRASTAAGGGIVSTFAEELLKRERSAARAAWATKAAGSSVSPSLAILWSTDTTPASLKEQRRLASLKASEASQATVLPPIGTSVSSPAVPSDPLLQLAAAATATFTPALSTPFHPSSCLPGSAVTWQWQTDDGTFVSYSARASEKLESRFRAGRAVASLVHDGQAFDIYFGMLVQVDMDGDHFGRPRKVHFHASGCVRNQCCCGTLFRI